MIYAVLHYAKKDFDIFLDIMIKTKWNANVKLG